ncbi:MAG TPA: tetratricopeptide repeat protein, partial [Chloroflexi bacterium]|nr:tetratricopeptide repeat protein [Chloroflexota bacterium]
MAEISLQKYCERIETMVEQGLYQEAEAHGMHILKQYPKHIETYQLLGKTMLESRRHEEAIDMFQRVLSADPENLIAWVGMSEVYSQKRDLDAATYYLELAFELAADNEVVEAALRNLYGQRDGFEPHRIELTRAALARLYLRGNLLPRAVKELGSLWAEHPDRFDLAATLAEALWHNEQRLEASEVCRQILDQLPHCIKANLILGEIWTSSGREEGDTYLKTSQALDPENRMAQAVFGDASPLLPRDVQVTLLERPTATIEERPAWMVEAEAAQPETPADGISAALLDTKAALETQIEIPSWLEQAADEGEAAGIGAELGAAEKPMPPQPPLAPPELEAEPPPAEKAPPPAEEIPDWLAGIGDEFAAEPAAVPGEEHPPDWLTTLGLEYQDEPAGEPVPDWLAEMGTEPVGPPEYGAQPTSAPEPAEIPDWMQELAPPAKELPPTPVEAAPEPAEIPDWMQELAPPAKELPPTPIEAAPEPAEIPDWMQELAPPVEELPPTPIEAAPEPAEIPDWMQELAPPEAPPPAEAEEEALPAWLMEEGEMPSGDDALAWL